MTVRAFLLVALAALAFGFAGAWIFSATGLGDRDRRAWLLDNPDVLPEMVAELERRESAGRLAEVEGEALDPFPGAVLGNPEGARVLVEFTDYGCTYCAASRAHVEELVARDPELKVVVREWPIFEGSEQAARMALAAARQGRFGAFHDAMFAAGPPSEQTIAAAAARAGLDLARARADAASPEVDFELARNRRLAQAIGFTGTPSWIANGRVIEGAVGTEALAEALEGDG